MGDRGPSRPKHGSPPERSDPPGYWFVRRCQVLLGVVMLLGVFAGTFLCAPVGGAPALALSCMSPKQFPPAVEVLPQGEAPPNVRPWLRLPNGWHFKHWPDVEKVPAAEVLLELTAAGEPLPAEVRQLSCVGEPSFRLTPAAPLKAPGPYVLEAHFQQHKARLATFAVRGPADNLPPSWAGPSAVELLAADPENVLWAQPALAVTLSRARDDRTKPDSLLVHVLDRASHAQAYYRWPAGDPVLILGGVSVCGASLLSVTDAFDFEFSVLDTAANASPAYREQAPPDGQTKGALGVFGWIGASCLGLFALLLLSLYRRRGRPR